MNFKKCLFIACQYILPHHILSRLVGALAQSRVTWFKNKLIDWFVRHYDVDMSQAVYEGSEEYENFNAFFTRALKEGMRPIDAAKGSIVCPADGCVSQMGSIVNGKLLQAKGHDFSLVNLLGGDTKRAEPFMGGEFATVYLSPRDYHRIHMPVAGTLREMIYVPGRLFSVNQTTAETVPGLFARNERVVCIFDTEYGSMAVVLVGAMIVASIETVWAGVITPPKRELRAFSYDEAARQEIHLEKGAELGRFKLGSTAIVVFEPNKISWNKDLGALSCVKMGEAMAVCNDM